MANFLNATAVAVLALLCIISVNGFSVPTSINAVRRSANVGLRMGYVPDGLTPEQWKKIQDEEKAKQKNLGRVGPRGFKSRSFSAWQAAGGKHLFPVDPKKVASGEIPLDQVPYMQRGGSWDNSDLVGKVKGVKAVQWSKEDEEYGRGGYKKEQSVSIFGGKNLPWVQKYEALDARAFGMSGTDKNTKRSKIAGGVDEATLKKMREEIKAEQESGLFSMFRKK